MNNDKHPTDDRPNGAPPEPEAGDTVLYRPPDPSSRSSTAAGSFPPDAMFFFGNRVGSFRVLRFLGRGGMGEVYEAEQVDTGRRVALKAMRANPRRSPLEKKRFEREGQLAAAVNHPNSVYIFGTEETEGALLISMELVRGGTLEERVEKRGPMAHEEAVDAVLQLAAGLRSAGEAGILHRDIKPSNCFIDGDGKVKIGDFGLSLSVSAPEETKLTTEGSFIGTPAFASPEQVRGGEMDVRSDIYSLGATLYYLLTGRTPFEEAKGVALLAAILERPPEPPRAARPKIPKALSDFVLRCLAKSPERRFADWDAFIRSLRRFAPSASTPAAPGIRLAAGIVDILIVDVFLRLIPVPGLSFYNAVQGAQERAGGPAPQFILYSIFLFLLYGVLLEGLTGTTVGKWMCGLRTVGPDGGKPGVRRAAVRAAVFAVHAAVPLLGIPIYSGGVRNFTLVSSSLDALSMVVILLLFIRARRSNGFAGIHELLSGTRVVHRTPRRETAAIVSREPDAFVSATPERIGPYSVIGEIGGTENERVLLGYDEQLDRRIWIVRVPPGTPPVPAARRDIARPGRLRWLTGRRGGAGNWDAYQAPDGWAFPDAARRARPWKETRRWLLDLATEFEEGRRSGTLPERVGTDRVWIEAKGRAVLLDFPAPTAADFSGGPADEIDPGDFEQVQSFLHRIVSSSLRGAAAPEGGDRRAAPLPLTATRLVDRLGAKSWEGPGDLLRALVAYSLEGIALSRWRRLGHILIPLSVILMMAAGATITGNHMAMWEKNHPDHLWLKTYLRAIERAEPSASREGAAGRPDGPEDRAALERILAAEFGARFGEADFWETDATYLSGNGYINESRRALGEEAIRRAGDPTAEEVAAARARLDPFLRAEEERIASSNNILRETLQASIAGIGFTGLFIGILALLSSLAHPGGALFRPFGIAVVDGSGRPARRGRGLRRTILSWSPAFVLSLLLIAHLWFHTARSAAAAVFFPVEIALVLFWAGAVILGTLRPERGVQDILSGTWLVPR
ncbi:MAG: protein kinase [Candidatus Eisenbacteria bacterium]|nr:protein kinase [Candidatus Eisenbacteria bacterium]